MDGCAKSQSFYSGMNQLVHVAANSSALSTTTTTTTTATTTGDSSRVRNNKSYYNSCHHQQISCSTSPSASLASTVSLCPSHLLPHDCPSRYPLHQIVQLHAPHLQHWLQQTREVVPQHHLRHQQPQPPPLPSPYIYSSAYEFENPEAVSPSFLSSNLSVEHIYSQIPSPQTSPKLPPQQGN